MSKPRTASITSDGDPFSFKFDAKDLPPVSEHNGVLNGVAVAIKDNIDVKDAPCSAGLPHLEGRISTSDAPVVLSMRAAGARLVGMTKTDCGAFGVTTPQVSNPQFKGRTVGGSSGGSGAAVAAQMCGIALGTDTGGSVRIPAACCGVYGFKPTYGRIPIEGVRKLTNSFDHVGALASSVNFLKRFMQAADPDFDQTGALDAQSREISIGIPEEYFGDGCDEVKQAVTQFRSKFASNALKFTIVTIPHPDRVREHHFNAIAWEAASLYRDLPEVYFKRLPDTAKVFLQFGRNLREEQYTASMSERKHFVDGVENVLNDVDFVILPTLPILPPMIDVKSVEVGDKSMDVVAALTRYTVLFDQTGHPVLSFPIELDGLDIPLSLQLVGGRNKDKILLEFAEKIGI